MQNEALITVGPLNLGRNFLDVRVTDGSGAVDHGQVIITREFPPEGIPRITSISMLQDRSNSNLNTRDIRLEGTARDNVSIAQVLYRVGTLGPFQPAIGKENWSFDLGNYRGYVQIKPVDNAGNEGPIEQVLVVTTPEQPRDILVLTPSGDIWVSEWTGKFYALPMVIGSPYFTHDVPNRAKTLGGDFDGDGTIDFFHVGENGRLRVAKNTGLLTLHPPQTLSTGWRVDEANGYTVLAGNMNDDELTDLVQINPDGAIYVAFNMGGELLPPALVANTNLRHNPSSGRHVFLQRVFGELDDIVEVDSSANVLRVVQNMNGTFENPISTPATVMHLPEEMRAVLFGNFTADNLTDLVEVHDQTAFLQEATAPGIYADEEFLAKPGFHADPSAGEGWWVFARDITDFEGDDIIQITEYGDIWVAPSYNFTTETSYNHSLKVGTLGFHHKPQGKWQIFFGNAR